MIEKLFTLERSIPESVAMGVLSGKYAVHGGVIRDAGGRIVRHLVPAAATSLNPLGALSAPFDIFNTFQLRDIAKTTQQLVSMSQATMALSGLNLAVSAVGFTVLYRSLKKVDERVKALDKKLSWIKTFLESDRRATLLLAADELSSLPTDREHRIHILHSSRERLGHASMHYREHLENSTDLLESMSYQHFFCTAFLMRARCSAELGMFDKASGEIEAGSKDWSQASRRIAKNLILADQPERFLQKDYVDILPTAKLAEWMDFAHAENRGIGWIDSLRTNFSESGISKLKGLFSGGLDDKDREQVTYMHNLVARSSVLEGYKSQYHDFQNSQTTPSEFYKEIDKLPPESASEGFYILAPIQSAIVADKEQTQRLQAN